MSNTPPVVLDKVEAVITFINDRLSDDIPISIIADQIAAITGGAFAVEQAGQQGHWYLNHDSRKFFIGRVGVVDLREREPSNLTQWVNAEQKACFPQTGWTTFAWMVTGVGFGECRFSYDENGLLIIDSEGMGPQFIKDVMGAMVDQAFHNTRILGSADT